MDFVEKLFHVSPDGGSGAYEALIVVLAGSLVLAIAFFRYFQTRPARKDREGKR